MVTVNDGFPGIYFLLEQKWAKPACLMAPDIALKPAAPHSMRGSLAPGKLQWAQGRTVRCGRVKAHRQRGSGLNPSMKKLDLRCQRSHHGSFTCVCCSFADSLGSDHRFSTFRILFSTLSSSRNNMEARRSSEMSVPFYHTGRHHTPGCNRSHSKHKSHKIYSKFLFFCT